MNAFRVPLLLALATGSGGCAYSPLLSGSPDGAADAADTPTPADDGGTESTDLAPPGPAPLGGTLTPTGATFKVWAPHADAVTVTGDFDGWGSTHALTKTAGDVWTGDVDGAQAGQRYRYLVSQGGQTVKRSDPRARALDDANGNSVLVDPNAYVWKSAPFVAPDFDHQIIYELHVGTFNVRAGEMHGTYQSAIERLDALVALGVNMIELLPINEFPGTRSWGYNPAAPFAVESSYGTPDDFRALVDAAHARGIGVIVDVVHNHYDTTLLRCWDGDCLGKQGIYFYTNQLANTAWGPRPDFGRPQVQSYVVDNTLMWLSEYRCDGLRWDSTINIHGGNGDGWTLLRSMNDAAHTRSPRTIQIAEDWQGDANISRKTKDGGGGFDAQWDGFVHDINGAILAGSDGARSMATVKGAIEREYNAHATDRVIFTESHDEVANGRQRIPEMITPGDAGSLAARQRSTLGAAIVFTSPGIPMLFMGQEMLTNGYFADNRPLDWTRATTYAGIVKLYTDLAHLRRNADGATLGLTGDGVSVFHVNDSAKVIAWRRWKTAGDDVVVIANFSGAAFAGYAIGLPAAGNWKVRFRSDATAYSPDFDGTASADVVATHAAADGLAYKGSIALGRYSAVILSR
ncbi:MAG: 1,4-alpha-glucan-branching protein [Myxococcales bacterium]|nr:1,4-alpha-glucan-branching protein [Myxococcales bacterium]